MPIKVEKYIYEDIADKLANQITKGVYKVGEQIPSVRKLSQDLGISTKTVEQSYIFLEGLGLIEAKPQKGYYVRNITSKILCEPEKPEIEISANSYSGEELVGEFVKSAKIPDAVLLGLAVPSNEILPGKKLNQILARICKDSDTKGIGYEFPPGNYDLRQQIAKRSIEWKESLSPDDMIITNGTTEGLMLALQSVAKSGDCIITESPTSFGILQVIDNLGMKTIEIPTHPRSGIDITVLRSALNSHKVGAAILCPNISNPLGSIMPDESKIELYKMFLKKEIPIIEDDVYGELYFSSAKPKSVKAYDEKGIVIYCSSFSKTIAPGYRIGWMYPGRYFKKANKLKIFTSYASATLPQMAIAEFLRTGGYDRSLRELRKKYESQTSIISRYVSEYFPEDTKLSKPQGGFFLWIELPRKVSSLELQKLALKKKITIAPGPLFSTHINYLNYIRLSCGFPLTPEIKDAIRTLGLLCKSLM